MKVPASILQGLAVALTGAGLTGCGFIRSTPTSTEPSVETTSCEPDTQNNARPNHVNLPDPCPACGRG